MLKLFSGSASLGLGKNVAEYLRVPLAKVEIVRFGNSELKVTIQENVKDKVCAVIQSTSNPTDTNFMELCFFCDALKRSGAKEVIGIVPYFGYARQNREHRSGECVSANVVIKFIETIGFSQIWTFDLHDEATEGIFSIPFKGLSTLPLLAKEIKKFLITGNDVIVVSPDQGGVERSRLFADSFFGNKNEETAVVEKKRNLDSVHQSKAIELYGNVKNKTVILVDDIATSGGTIINAANLCLQNGAKRILAAVTHHDFTSGAPTKLQNSPIEKFFTTNTIALKANQKFKKLEEISVTQSLAAEIKISS